MNKAEKIINIFDEIKGKTVERLLIRPDGVIIVLIGGGTEVLLPKEIFIVKDGKDYSIDDALKLLK